MAEPVPPVSAPAAVGELRALVRLAVPLAVVYFGNHLLGVVDTAVVGRLGEVALAAVGLGNGLYFAIGVVGIGTMLGLDPIISQSVGAGRHDEARRGMWQGVWLPLGLAVPLGIVTLAIVAVLEPLGIEAVVVADVRGYVVARVAGMAPMFLLVGLRSYLSAYDVTRPLVIGMVLANVLNVPLSWLLVFGDAGLVDVGLPALGVPALGAAGAGWTSTFCTALQCGVAVVAVRWLQRGGPVSRRIDPVLLRRALRLGIPVGLTLLAEVGSFGLVGFFAGLLGSRALAAHNVALTLAATTFQVPLAVGAASAILVGRAVGRDDHFGARRAGLVALGAGLAFMMCSSLLFWVLPTPLAYLLTDKAHIVAAAVPLLFVAAAFQLVDGLQVVAAGALRGAGDTRFALFANIIGHYVLGLPLGVVLAFVFGMGARGLWWGLSLGLATVAVALCVRFLDVSKRPIRRV